MKKKLYLDTETRSSVNLTKSTVHKYVKSDDFSIILITYAIDDGDVHVIEPYDEDRKCYNIPSSFITMLTDNTFDKVIHNASFDLKALQQAGIANIPHSQIIDTYTQAKAHALPASLSNLSKLFGLGDDSKKSGTRLINRFSKPSKDGIFLTKYDDPDRWLEFIDYAKFDIVSLREVYKRLPDWNYPLGQENYNFYLNRLINNRGLRIDIEFLYSAVQQYRDYQVRINDEFVRKYGFKPSQNKVLLEYLRDIDPSISDVSSETLQSIKNEQLRDIIDMKLLISNNTPRKYISLLDNIVGDRIKDTLNFMGAAKTGRDSGKIFQPQNLKRPQLFSSIDNDDEENKAIEDTIDLFKKGKYSNEVSFYLGELIRNIVIPSAGYKFVVSDLSNIEGRTLSYLAGEEYKINNFRLQDKGELKYDNYILAYANTMGVSPETVTKEQRSIGKVMELALGYGGGLNAFKNFFDASGMSYDDLSDRVISHINKSGLSEKNLYHNIHIERCGKALSSVDHIKACMFLINKWRSNHINTAKFWSRLELAFKHCCKTRESIRLHSLVFSYLNNFLRIQLPSGRLLCYYKADENMNYLAPINSTYTKIKTYGGKLAENVASGMARDILYENVKKIEKYGFKTVMLVHDEVITEAPDNNTFNANYLSSLLSSPIDWAPGLPLSASGFESYRYKGK